MPKPTNFKTPISGYRGFLHTSVPDEFVIPFLKREVHPSAARREQTKRFLAQHATEYLLFRQGRRSELLRSERIAFLMDRHQVIFVVGKADYKKFMSDLIAHLQPERP